MSTEFPQHRFAELPPEELAILRERSRETARAVAPVAAEHHLEVLEVVSRGQTYAIPIIAVEGVADLSSIATVPRLAPFVRGLVSFRGEVVLAVELTASEGAASKGFSDLRRLICLSAGGMKLAILAERVMVVRSVDPATFAMDPLVRSGYVLGTNTEFVTLLDPACFIEHVFRSMVGAP